MRTRRKSITGHGQTTRNINSLQHKDTREFPQIIAIIVHPHTYQQDIISGAIVATIPEEETLLVNARAITIKGTTTETRKEPLTQTQGITPQSKEIIAIVLGIVILTIIPITAVNKIQGRDNRNIIIKMIPLSQEIL